MDVSIKHGIGEMPNSATEQLFFLRPEQISCANHGKRNSERNAIIRLSESIRRYGILDPLTVFPAGENNGMVIYEIAEGECRYRAACLCGLSRIPCRLAPEKAARIAEYQALEQLRTSSQSPFTQAKGFQDLILTYGMTQEEIARKLGISQSAVANKLRLLRFSADEQKKITEANLTERHARALLRVAPSDRETLISEIVMKKATVSQTELLVEQYLASRNRPQPNSDTSENNSTHGAKPQTIDEERLCSDDLMSKSADTNTDFSDGEKNLWKSPKKAKNADESAANTPICNQTGTDIFCSEKRGSECSLFKNPKVQSAADKQCNAKPSVESESVGAEDSHSAVKPFENHDSEQDKSSDYTASDRLAGKGGNRAHCDDEYVFRFIHGRAVSNATAPKAISVSGAKKEKAARAISIPPEKAPRESSKSTEQRAGVQPRRFALQDLRPLYNSIDRTLSIFRKTGASAECTRQEDASGARIIISIRKQG